MSINGMIMKNPDRERSDALEKLEMAAAIIEQSMDVRLIPVEGTKFGYAIRGLQQFRGGLPKKTKCPTSPARAHLA
jgi:hypothetical protein